MERFGGDLSLRDMHTCMILINMLNVTEIAILSCGLYGEISLHYC